MSPDFLLLIAYRYPVSLLQFSHISQLRRNIIQNKNANGILPIKMTMNYIINFSIEGEIIITSNMTKQKNTLLTLG